jgi:asparagine synthase (glutamine-hydrolysing)
VWPRSPWLPRPLRLARTFDNLAGDRAAAYYADLCFLKPDGARRLLGHAPTVDPQGSPVFDVITAPYRRCTSADPVQRAEYADLKGYLSNDVLVKVDRMSMAHALEVRCPLLDRRIVEFAFRVPVSKKMPKLQPKALLRGLAAGRLPDRIRTLPKHGFTAPVAEWLAGPSAERFRAEVLGGDARTASMIDRAHVAKLFAEHRARRQDHGYALWAVWMLERWARQQKAPQSSSLIRTVGGAA